MLSPEQAQDLVDHFGGQRPAARAVGMYHGTLWNWLHPERKRERDRHYQRRRRAEGRAWDQQPENAERVYERKANWYWNLSGFEYNRRLLKLRHSKALARMAIRNERRRTDG